VIITQQQEPVDVAVNFGIESGLDKVVAQGREAASSESLDRIIGQAW
jgi:hypothetical protein